jgi:hypothetical protein
MTKKFILTTRVDSNSNIRIILLYYSKVTIVNLSQLFQADKVFLSNMNVITSIFIKLYVI